MGLDDYVIACRSYKRANVFPHKTYRMLAHNGLTDRLYIFVANQEEKDLYEQSLKGLPYKKIVIGEIGCAAVVRSICAYFPLGQRIAFMDDDLSRFYCFDSTGKYDKDSTKLHKYLEDGFSSIDKFNLGAFSFSFLSNKFYLQGKPFKEFRPAALAGSFFATRNNPQLILTKPYTSHAEDVQRAVQFIDHFGGVLVYWWAGFETYYGEEEGGIQASGERGNHKDKMDRLKKTEAISWRMYKEEPLLQAYSQEPKLVHKDMFYSLKLKTGPQIRKIQKERGAPVRHARWFKWWNTRPTEAEL